MKYHSEWCDRMNGGFECNCEFSDTPVDARLLAELLAALKEVVALSDRKHDAWDRAHAAIAKAEATQ